LIKRGALAIPDQYNTGTAILTTNSPVVGGINTFWPVNDWVNTIAVEQVRTAGVMWVTPASLQNITLDTILYVDDGMNPEICPVLDILANRILLNFTLPHNANFTLWASTLNGRQFRMGSTNPVFSVMAVTSPSSLTLQTPWGARSLPSASYQILLMYTPFQPDLKELIDVTDPVQQIRLRTKVQQYEVNQYDPNRMATDSPTSIVDLGPNPNGSMLYEIYPPQSVARQLYYIYIAQWPDMRLPTDMAPNFINPGVWIYGAMADAHRTFLGRPPDYKDSAYSVDMASMYEQKFESAVIDAMNADEALAQKAFQYAWGQIWGMGMGANFWQMHDFDAMNANF